MTAPSPTPTANALLLALALAGLAIPAASWLTPAAAPAPVARPAAAPPRAAPPTGLPLLRPTPLVSLGAWVRASAPNAPCLVDGRYRGTAWGGGKPTAARPAWVALRLQRAYRRLLLSWTSSHNHDYFEQYYGAPRDYRIETSADSTDGQDGHWSPVVTLVGNRARTRSHAIPFEGKRWVRLSVSALPDAVNPYGLFLDEIELHDLSAGGDDVWIFLGDSIGAGVFDRADAHRPSFSDEVARRHPGYAPVMVNAGLPRLRSWEAVDQVDSILALNPDARVVAVTIGSNDGDLPRLRAALRGIVGKVRAAGKIPVLARIPFQTKYGQDYVAVKNEVVDEVTREEGLLPGPDLYAWFKRFPGRLHDGLHPDAQGSVDMQRLWAEAVDGLYPAPAPAP